MTYFIWRKGAFRNPNWQANKLGISGGVPENSEKKIPKKELLDYLHIILLKNHLAFPSKVTRTCLI